ncbi:hypothetical protein [Streptomyces sp. 900105755]
MSTWLGYESAADVGVHTAESANSESETSDTTTLSNSLAALSADGSTVTVYTTADETFTTGDTKNGTTDTTPARRSTRTRTPSASPAPDPDHPEGLAAPGQRQGDLARTPERVGPAGRVSGLLTSRAQHEGA